MSCDFIFVHDAKFLIKHIFALHIIKKNNFYFLLSPDSNLHLHSHKVPSPSQLELGWFAAAAPNRQTSRPDLVKPAGSPSPPPVSITNAHQTHQMPDPILPIPNSLLIVIPIREFLLLTAGYGDR